MSTDETTDRLVEIGRIGRPHGVRGELKLHLYNAASTLLEDLPSIRVGKPEGPLVRYDIEAVRGAAQAPILALVGVEERNAAAALCGAHVFVPRESLPAVEPDEFYIADLIGLTVRADGRPIGQVVGSRAQGEVEILLVAGDGFELEVPLVDTYVLRLDWSARVIECTGIDDMPRSRTRRKEP